MSAATDEHPVIELARELIAYPSENPPGRERDCVNFVLDWFEHAGIPATLIERPESTRPSAAAQVGSGAPTVVLNGHVDVVPAGDPTSWADDPYEAVVRDSRLYGRGAADMKTGLAMAMQAATELATELSAGDGSIVVHAAAGEETGYPGTRALLDAGYGGDVAVVLEPTGLRVATRAKGVATYRFVIAGESSHASRPDQARNPLDGTKLLFDAIADYDDQLRQRTDPLCGSAYATVTEVVAGTDDNMAVIPDRAEVLVDRRLIPSESIETVEAELDAIEDRLEDVGFEIDRSLVQHYAAAGISSDRPIATTFAACSRQMAGVEDHPIGLEAATDAREFIADGTDAIIWGPGSLEQAHTVDEWISLDEVMAGYEVLTSGLRQLFDLD